MDCFLVQTIIIARNGEAEPWMQILVLVVMAVFWVIGSILKSKKEAEEARKAKGHEKPTAKRLTLFERAFGQQGQIRLGVQPQQSRVAPEHTFEQKPPHTRQATTLRQLKRPDLSDAISQAQSKLKTIPKQEVELSLPPEAIQPSVPAEEAQLTDGFLSSLINFDEPDNLARAILYYEVLGKPLSLRDPSQDIIGLSKPSDHSRNS